MIRIYCIEDINDLKYIGSTKKPLNKRLSGHRTAKKRGEYCSSSKLDLEHSVIYEIERCHEDERKEKECYWINEIDCVNERKLNFNKNENMKEYYQRNKDKRRDKKNEYQRDYQQRIRISKFLKILEEY